MTQTLTGAAIGQAELFDTASDEEIYDKRKSEFVASIGEKAYHLASGGRTDVLTLDDYQDLADDTSAYPGKGTIMGLAYTGLGLGEAGEVQGKIKKILRDDQGVLSRDKAEAIAAELGDLLWYVSQTANEIGYSLSAIATGNLDKLASRKARGVIGGSGDNR